MSPARASMTRLFSTDSSASSNIQVAGPSGAQADDSASEQAAEAFTPPTSVSDGMHSSNATADDVTPVNEPSGRRSKRARSSIGTYNLKHLSDAQQPLGNNASPRSRKASGLSGRTLVGNGDDEEQVDAEFSEELDQALNKDWEIPADSPRRKSASGLQRKPSIKDRVKSAAGTVKSVLGKRGRDMIETGKRTLGIRKEEEQVEESPQKNKLLRELDLGKRGVLDELDLDQDYSVPLPPRPSKRAKKDKTGLTELAKPVITGPMQKTSDGKRVKKWQNEGLYVGQEVDQESGPRKLKKKRPASAMSESSGNAVKKSALSMSLPMFDYLEEKSTRDFVIPFDVFAPSLRKGDEKPKDWKQLNRNRLIGDAKDLWEKEERLPQSACVCRVPASGDELGCGEDCLNRVMQYECNQENCNLNAALCSNRPFAELGERLKKGGAFDIGVEVIKTEKRGFGIRAARSFKPGQIIMEYTGEIISEAECQRRMQEVYNNKQCYYLMELERNLVIDGTKGSMARFINHSCEPNCEVRMLKVNGTPRMAVFAGETGIMTGEELTYDYNFDNFGDSQQNCFCGAATCRGTLSKRLNAVELKKLARVEEERKRKAAEAALKAQEEEERKKKVKTDRGSGWRGWVAVDDPETKALLKAEKRLKEEAEKNSDRAKRLAARRTTAPQEPPKSPGERKKASPRRRRTVQSHEGITSKSPVKTEAQDEAGDEDEDEDEEEPTTTMKRFHHPHRASTGSHFAEDLDQEQRRSSRPGSKHGARGFSKKIASSTISVKSSVEVQRETPAENAENETIVVGTSADIAGEKVHTSSSSKKRTALRKRKSVEMKDEDEDEDEDGDRAMLARPTKRNSLLGSVPAAIKSAGRVAFGSVSSGKLRQSTLNFARKG